MSTRKVQLKSKEEIEFIRQGGKLIRQILLATAKLVQPGVSTWALNEFAEQEIAKAGGRPAFKGYGQPPFPAALCTSINHNIVHGLPKKEEILQEGDIIGLDLGMAYKGMYTDTAITVPVGKVKPDVRKLLEVTSKALDLAIEQAYPGKTIGAIAWATQGT